MYTRPSNMELCRIPERWIVAVTYFNPLIFTVEEKNPHIDLLHISHLEAELGAEFKFLDSKYIFHITSMWYSK